MDDIVLRKHVQSWSTRGEAEWSVHPPHTLARRPTHSSRAFVVAAHSNPAAVNDLATVYTSLAAHIVTPNATRPQLPPSAFVAFVKSVVDALPSSSSSTSPILVQLSTMLVDAISTLDSILEETISNAKSSIEQCGDNPTGQLAIALARVKKAKQTAEKDKDILATVEKHLVEHGILAPSMCVERQDTALSASAGLIADKIALDKKEIRTRTSLFYKQNKFNLLREQSEGYSKLTAELTSSLGPPHTAATGLPTESYAAIHERARPVWEKVISLVGYFDLDPNRALDITLDVLSAHLVTHHTFFLALLSFSPWAGSYRRPQDGLAKMAVDAIAGQFKGKTLDEVLSTVDPYVAEDQGPVPPVMAQVLGFKFAYYQVGLFLTMHVTLADAPQALDVLEPTPNNLYLTAAILIREGFITVEDLYPHLSPDDSDMDKVHEDYLADVRRRINATKINALALAAPLPTDDRPSISASTGKPKTAPTEQKRAVESKKIQNQRAGIVAALLAVGALKPALAILSKYPWFVDAQPQIADLLLRILKISIAPLYDTHLVTKQRNPSFALARPRYGTTGVSPPPPRKPTLTACAPTPPCTSTQDFVFFFPQWTERIPLCSDLGDLLDVIEPLVAFLGPHLSRDSIFMTKLLRLGRLHVHSTVTVDPETKRVQADPDNPIRTFWYTMLRKYLLPALSLVRGNAICTVEVWTIMRFYETDARWRLYGEWRSATYKSHPELRVRQEQVDKESKDVLGRLSSNTYDGLSGAVAKLAHGNPCIFFTKAVTQIMAYDNLSGVIVQSLRYVTNMGFDVLLFVVLDALANPHKHRVKEDGVNISDWLQSLSPFFPQFQVGVDITPGLASFTGMLFRRFSADLTMVLKYIVNQLHNGQTADIVVLRELIWKMAGIEPLPSLSEHQISAMAGGPVLRIEAIASETRGARLDPGEVLYKAPTRLGHALVDSALAFPLLVQVAQQRDSCVHKAHDAHLKSLASLFDTTHGVLLQYVELLTSHLVIAPQDYAEKVLPTLGELGELYGISAPICMHIIRPVLNAKLLAPAEAMQEQERLANTEAEKRLKAALTAKKPQAANSRTASPGAGTSTPDTSAESKSLQETISKEDVAMEPVPNAPEAGRPISIHFCADTILQSPWLAELVPLFEDIKRIAPASAYDVVGPAFYVTFWQLSTYDIAPPMAKYEEQTKALRDLSNREDTKYNQADRSADRSIRSTAQAHRLRRDRHNQFLSSLSQEAKQQMTLRAFTIKRLNREKQHWFTHSKNAGDLMSAIIEHCIQPRCLLSPMDADYCAQIIKVLHSLGTPGFHTLQCYNKASCDTEGTLNVLTASRNYGLFLRGILTDIHKWFTDQKAFIADNQTTTRGTVVYHPGLVLKYTVGKKVQQSDMLDWDKNYKQLVRKWHKNLAKSIAECIGTGEFMRVHNSIIVLKEILPVFPLALVLPEPATVIMQAMEKFLEIETRDNLKVLGRSYYELLKKREPQGQQAAKVTKPAVAAKPAVSAPSDKGKTTASPAAGATSRAPTASAPSAPRSQLSVPATEKTVPAASSTNSAFANIQRPPVVKRVRDAANTNAEDGGSKEGTPKAASRYNSPAASGSKETPMAPPAAPSQTQSAQELRETAKQTMGKKDEPRSQNGSRGLNGTRNERRAVIATSAQLVALMIEAPDGETAIQTMTRPATNVCPMVPNRNLFPPRLGHAQCRLQIQDHQRAKQVATASRQAHLPQASRIDPRRPIIIHRLAVYMLGSRKLLDQISAANLGGVRIASGLLTRK
ncbi:hypothetical protein MKEN_00079700 [Mycena kentingensis (nom. inval.)]|nr:hypothetical protein MKEN_00079700 [Mycena kentingensis (nom. inval.)]